MKFFKGFPEDILKTKINGKFIRKAVEKPGYISGETLEGFQNAIVDTISIKIQRGTI